MKKAFPSVFKNDRGNQAVNFGMDLRDYFAAAALQGYIMRSEIFNRENAAQVAYEYADAMLVEREIKNDNV